MAEVVGSRVERRRKSARERRAQALRAEARRFRREQAMGAAMAYRGDFFSERFGVRSQLRCGVLLPQGRVSSVPLPCSAFPYLAIPVLAAQDSDGHDPKLVEALLLRSLRGREAELEALNLFVKEDVGQFVSVAAPVAALVTSSHAPVSVSAAGPSCSSQSSGVSRFVGEEVLWSQVDKLCHLFDGRWASLGTGHAMLLKHIASGQVRFLMQDMSSQVLCTVVVYTCQSLCVLKRSSRSRQSCSWRADNDGMLVHFALVFSSHDLVSKFMEKFDAAKLATDSCCDSPWVLGHDGWCRLDFPG